MKITQLVRNQKGQSTIEFALSFIFLFAFILFFVQMAMVMAFGSYVQYATFMSARALQSAGPNEDDQLDRAKQVLVRMLKTGGGNQDRWTLLGQGEGDGTLGVKGATIGTYRGPHPSLRFDAGDPTKSWLEGVRYSFRARMFMIPSVGGSDPSASEFVFDSESFLQREPSYEECIEDLITRVGGEIGRTLLIDNGC